MKKHLLANVVILLSFSYALGSEDEKLSYSEFIDLENMKLDYKYQLPKADVIKSKINEKFSKPFTEEFIHDLAGEVKVGYAIKETIDNYVSDYISDERMDGLFLKQIEKKCGGITKRKISLLKKLITASDVK